jgi:phosphohistidine phosphatase
MRHAKSAWPDVPDRDRPVAPRGRRDAPVMGHWLAGAGYIPDRIVCSTALRARQTWQLTQPVLGSVPAAFFDDRVYEASQAQLLDLIRGTPAATRTLLIVGHDPAVPELACTLAAADAEASAGTVNDAAPAVMLDRMRAKFPTAAIAVLECTGDWEQLAPERVRLACFVTPRELRGPGDRDGDVKQEREPR